MSLKPPGLYKLGLQSLEHLQVNPTSLQGNSETQQC